MPPLKVTALLALLVALAPLPAGAQEPPRLRAGASTLRLEEPHPAGRLRRQASRFGWSAEFLRRHRARELDPAKESLRVVVPAVGLDPPPGLLVWVGPGDTGQVPAEWLPVLARRRLVAVGADRSGNDRAIWDRVGLALAAVHRLLKAHPIDPSRVFVAGYSGGALIASRLAFHYPEVFAGGYYMGGCNWWKEIAVPGSEPRRVWPARFPAPEGSRLRQVKLVSRHVFLVGADDFNRDHAHGIYRDARRREGFRHLLWQELPGAGHVWAPPDALERGLAFLDGEVAETR